MKKYLLGLFALVLAVGFSAFTSKNYVQKASTQELYWYSVNSIGESSPSDLINTSQALTKDDFRSEFSPECDEITSDACVRGFVNPLNTTVTVDGAENFYKE